MSMFISVNKGITFLIVFKVGPYCTFTLKKKTVIGFVFKRVYFYIFRFLLICDRKFKQ